MIGLLLVFMVGPYTPGRQSILGWHFNLSATNTFLALVIAEVYESAPYYTYSAPSRPSPAWSPRLEQQAGLLGDRPRRVFRRVTLPLAAPGLAMALSVAWARAMGAFGAVIIIAYHPAGIPLQIYVDHCRRPAWPPRCRTPWSCWWSRSRCRWPPISGAPVLDADVEVERREFDGSRALCG